MDNVAVTIIIQSRQNRTAPRQVVCSIRRPLLFVLSFTASDLMSSLSHPNIIPISLTHFSTVTQNSSFNLSYSSCAPYNALAMTIAGFCITLEMLVHIVLLFDITQPYTTSLDAT